MQNPNSTKELVVPTAQMLTLTENEMRLAAAGQTPCEEYVTNKSAVTNEKLSTPTTRSRVVLKHQVQKIETSKPESKANIIENIDSEAKPKMKCRNRQPV